MVTLRSFRSMRVVGYARELPGPDNGETVFSQGEYIRRWVNQHGHRLVAMFQDPRGPAEPPDLSGFEALHRVVAAGGIDAVVVDRLDAFSPDMVRQEIVVWDMETLGLKVVACRGEDTSPHLRATLRDILEKVEEYQHRFASHPDESELVFPLTAQDLVVELLPHSA